MNRASMEERKNPGPYPPSWLDRLGAWVNRLPGPAWPYYAGAAVLTYAVYLAVKWWDGSLTAGTIPRVEAVITASIFYYPWLTQHLDKAARTALSRFRPALAAPEAPLAELSYQLTNLPARPVRTLTVAGIVYGLIVTVAVSQNLLAYSAQIPVFSSLPAAILESGGVIALTVFLLIFAYHTIHQLRVVSQIHVEYARIDLFYLDPLYSFSRLTAQTALGIIILQYFWVTAESWVAFDTLTIATGVAVVTLGIVAFVWPLLGLHGLLTEEKRRLKKMAGDRLRLAIDLFNAALDDADLERAEKLAKAMETAERERRIVAAIPTWPWEPTAVRGVVTAILLPLVVWFITQVLEQFLEG